MINVKDVSLAFGSQLLFYDVSLAINAKDKIGLIGRNGSGKSTFLKMLLGEIQPDEGEIRIAEHYRVGYLSQHIHFTKSTVVDEVCSVLNEEREHEAWKGELILFGLGFSYEDLSKNPNEFSGGYQVKINLAKVLLDEPDMLILDEPTNYLDIYSIRWLGDFLKKWRGELILITHDRAFMDSVISHTLIIHRSRIRKAKGSTGKIRDQIAMEEEMYEKTRAAEEKKRKETEEWIKKFGAKASKAAAAQSRLKMLEKMEEKQALGHLQTLNFKFSYLPFASKDNMVTAKKIGFSYVADKPLIQNLSFTIQPHDKICIVGKNGNGKSTLLRLIAGEITPLSGDIKLHSKNKASYFGQTNMQRLHPELSVCEEMETLNKELDTGSHIEYQTIRKVCAQMMFGGDMVHKKISVLSGGEKSRVMLGKILLTPSNLLLLDEPTNHFDIESCESLMEAIKEFEGAVVIVTHDEYFLHEIANKLIVFDGGKITFFEGGYKDFLERVGWTEE